MKKSYLKGILGALLGGIIACIPWILTYVYGNMILSILAAFIAMGALKGYQLFNGKIDKKLSIIITVVSLVSITISTLLIIPCLLILKESVAISIENIKLLYSDEAFIGAIIRDFIISIAFTFLGISSVITSIKKQIEENKNVDSIKIELNKGNSKKDRERVKNLFLNKNAINEQNAIELDDDFKTSMDTINIMVNQKIITKKDNKYYYSEDEENKNKRKARITLIIIFSIVLTLFLIATFISDNDEPLDDLSEIKEVVYIVPDTYKEYIDEENENSWYYVPKDDISGYSGYIDVYYMPSNDKYTENWVEYIKEYILNTEGVVKLKSTEHFVNSYDYDVVVFDIEFEGYNNTIYYIFGNKKLGIVQVIDYKKIENLKKDGRDIANSFWWIESE